MAADCRKNVQCAEIGGDYWLNHTVTLLASWLLLAQSQSHTASQLAITGSATLSHCWPAGYYQSRAATAYLSMSIYLVFRLLVQVWLLLAQSHSHTAGQLAITGSITLSHCWPSGHYWLSHSVTLLAS